MMTGSDYGMQQANLAMGGASVAQPGKSADTTAAQKAAQEFEGVFLSQMLNQMFSGIETDSTFGGGAGEDMFRSLMIDEYGKEMASQGGIGLAKSVLKELVAAQEHAS